mmetsp:Transcript_34754/g.73954  ORF Transcript_34754/g.73954 Transcript_34754/m.73954 type:complete len:97 (-) Transcript_34754:326-616(-)
MEGEVAAAAVMVVRDKAGEHPRGLESLHHGGEEAEVPADGDLHRRSVMPPRRVTRMGEGPLLGGARGRILRQQPQRNLEVATLLRLNLQKMESKVL